MFRFEAIVTESIEEALEILNRDSDVVPIAGGTNLLVWARDGKIRLKKVLDLWGLRKQLSYIVVDGDVVRVGSMTTVNELCESRELRKPPLLGLTDVCSTFASPYIRSVATVGGNIESANPLSDIAIFFLTLDARVRLISLNGVREVPLTNYYKGMRSTVRERNELIKEVIITNPPPNSSTAFLKLDKRMGHIMGLAIGAAYAEFNGDTFKDVRISFDSVSKSFPERAFLTEEFLKGRKFCEEVLMEASESVLPKEMVRYTGRRASAEYRLHLSKVILRRILAKTYERVKLT
ncbi:MAG: FAD binding domain-containing protein [Thermoprotei archaeon]